MVLLIDHLNEDKLLKSATVTENLHVFQILMHHSVKKHAPTRDEI